MTSNCWQCLKTIEANVLSGEWKKVSPPLLYWYEMFDAENTLIEKRLKELKPARVLEIGAGGGRIIEIVLKNSDATIVALEKNLELYELVKERFKGNKRVQIFLGEKLPDATQRFDLALCMMNTLGNQQNETEFIRYALSVSDHFIFTVYKKGMEEIRQGIYKAMGHKKFRLKDYCFYFDDSWVKGLISRGYSAPEIKKMCEAVNCKATISDLCKIAYAAELEN